MDQANNFDRIRAATLLIHWYILKCGYRYTINGALTEIIPENARHQEGSNSVFEAELSKNDRGYVLYIQSIAMEDPQALTDGITPSEDDAVNLTIIFTKLSTGRSETMNINASDFVTLQFETFNRLFKNVRDFMDRMDKFLAPFQKEKTGDVGSASGQPVGPAQMSTLAYKQQQQHHTPSRVQPSIYFPYGNPDLDPFHGARSVPPEFFPQLGRMYYNPNSSFRPRFDPVFPAPDRMGNRFMNPDPDHLQRMPFREGGNDPFV
ncbi:hypothetical protein ACOME3_005155 [Neoechinorhynchus agilis]